RDGAQTTCMLFHPCIDGGIPLDSAVESQQIPSHRRSTFCFRNLYYYSSKPSRFATIFFKFLSPNSKFLLQSVLRLAPWPWTLGLVLPFLIPGFLRANSVSPCLRGVLLLLVAALPRRVSVVFFCFWLRLCRAVVIEHSYLPSRALPGLCS